MKITIKLDNGVVHPATIKERHIRSRLINNISIIETFKQLFRSESMLTARAKQPEIIFLETTSFDNVRQLIVFCPQCKALETHWFIEDEITDTRKFSQNNNRVYHDCGSKEPCRLYHVS